MVTVRMTIHVKILTSAMLHSPGTYKFDKLTLSAIEQLRAYSNRANANAKVKKIKEQAKEKISNINEKFRFRFCFRLV